MSDTDLTLDLIARQQAAILCDLSTMRDDMAILTAIAQRLTAPWPGWPANSTPRTCGRRASIAASMGWRRNAVNW